MKVKFYLAMVVAALMMTNCSQEESMIQSKGSTNVLTATIEGVTSRSSVTDGGVFSWDKGDAIAVGNSDKGFTQFVYDENGKFSASEVITPAGYAIYPYNGAYASYTEGTLPTVKLNDEYTYGSTNAPMLATIEENATSLSFKHLAGLMRFRVKNVPVTASKFTLTVDGKSITGEFTPETEDGEAYIETVEGETANVVKITFSEAEVKDVMDFYVPMPVGEYEKLTVTIGDKELSSGENVTNVITRGKLLLMPTMAFVEGKLTLEGGNNVALNANEVVTLDVNDGEEVVVDITEGTTATLNLTAPDNSTEGLTISDGSEEGTESSGTSDGTLNVSATNAATLNINTPSLTVKLTSGEYDKVVALTAQQTLIIGENVTIGELVLKGGNVKLEGDLALETPLVVGIETTIDLNGYKIEPAGTSMTPILNTKDALILVRKGGSLTIKDSSTEGKGRIDTGENSSIYGAIKMTDSCDDTNAGDATLTIESGTIKGYYYGIMGNGNGGNRNGTVITMNGGTIEAGYCEKDNTGIFHPQLGTLTISGGSITGYKSAVEMRSGTLTINGGTFESTGSPAEAAANANGNTITGAAIAVSQHTTNQELKAEISSGTFTGVYALYEEDKQDENVSKISMAVTGGTFNGSIFTENCKTAITGGTFSDPSVMDYLGANANVIVNMTESYEGPGFVTKSGQTVSLKMASNVVYTVKSPLVGSAGTKTLGFQFLNGSTVSVEGGKITSEEAKMLINNYTNLILKDVELAPTIPSTMNGQSYYVLSNNSGEVKLEGNTSIKAPTMEGIKSFAFDVCKYSTYDAPEVTVNTTGKIEGLVEVSGGTLNVTNGTFKNEIGHCVKVVTGTANFDGGEFTAQEVAVFNMAGNVKITMGTFTSNDNAVISGNGTDDAKYKNGTIEITGGVFNAKIQSSGYVACGIYHPQVGTLKVSGGTFNIENGCGILMRGGSLDMTGSQVAFNFTGAATADGKVGDSRIVVPCGKKIVKDACSAYYDAGNINIDGVIESEIYTVNSSQN